MAVGGESTADGSMADNYAVVFPYVRGVKLVVLPDFTPAKDSRRETWGHAIYR
jgi:hypothetical protein